MNSWHSYNKVYAIGHAYLKELFQDTVIIEEKCDGSQFSFSLMNGELKFRSKNQEFDEGTANKMFAKAVESVISIKHLLTEGWTYRAEYLQKPKHNVLAYDRIPEKCLILFDVNIGYEDYLAYNDKLNVAKSLGLECVPLLFEGKITNVSSLVDILQTTSILGGQKIEGIVVKNYKRFGVDGKALIGKYVSEDFKEIHGKEWKNGNPKQGDILELIIEKYKTPARWDKAIIHLKERGELEGSPRDIGKLVKEVPADLLSECGDEIKEQLYKWAEDKILRGVIRGLPQYYKERLMKEQFEQDPIYFSKLDTPESFPETNVKDL